MTTHPRTIYKTRDVCELLQVHRVTLHRYVKTGVIPAPFKLGKHVNAWKAEDVHAALDRMAGGQQA